MIGEKRFPALKQYGLTVLSGIVLGIILVFVIAYWQQEYYSAGTHHNSRLNQIQTFLAGLRDGRLFGINLQAPEKTSGPTGQAAAQSEAAPHDGTKILTDKTGGQAENSSGKQPESAAESNGPGQSALIAGQARPFTVLLVGVDNRPGENYVSNTDTLILANLNPAAGRLALLSVPRDTQINFPGYGTQKINAAARLGKGLNSTVSVLENLLGQPINGYIEVNFEGFKKIVDIVGGITITVEKDMYYNTGDKTDGIINLKKGTQRLNGSQALQYARFRHDNLADISRTMRQQAVIKALVKELWQVKTIAKLPWLLPEIYRATDTNLSLGELISLTNVLIRSEQVQVVSQTLPGDFAIEQGLSYWKINPEESRNTVRQFFSEGKTTSIFALSEGKNSWVPTQGALNNSDTALPVLSPDTFGQEAP